MEFILVLFVLFIWFDLFQPIEIKRTFRVNALPDGKDLSGFNRDKSTATEWALVLIVFVKTLIRGKRRSTDFAQILAFGSKWWIIGGLASCAALLYDGGTNR